MLPRLVLEISPLYAFCDVVVGVVVVVVVVVVVGIGDSRSWMETQVPLRSPDNFFKAVLTMERAREFYPSHQSHVCSKVEEPI